MLNFICRPAIIMDKATHLFSRQQSSVGLILMTLIRQPSILMANATRIESQYEWPVLTLFVNLPFLWPMQLTFFLDSKAQ